MGEPATPRAVSEAESLAAERASADVEHELWRGEVFAMAGASWAHDVITANLTTALDNRVRSQGCRAVREPQFHDAHEDVLVNPALVVEVLSPTTERFDRGEKANGYRSLESVRELLLVAQDERHVEHDERVTDGAWLLRVFERAEVVRLPGLGIAIAEIYDGVPGSES